MAIICHRKVGDRMKQKIIMRGTIILMVCAVLFSCLLMVETNRSTERKVAKQYASTIFQKDKVMEVNIIMDEDDWQDMLDNAREETYVACDVEVNGVTYKNVAIRPKGNTSLTQVTNDRYSFKIQFDKYQDGQTLDGLDQLVLNNNFADATYMKEYLAYDMFQYMGVVTPLYSYADVKINGETYGLYLALEGVKDSFAERNYGTNHGELYKPETEQGQMGGGKNEMPSPDKQRGNQETKQQEQTESQNNMTPPSDGISQENGMPPSDRMSQENAISDTQEQDTTKTEQDKTGQSQEDSNPPQQIEQNAQAMPERDGGKQPTRSGGGDLVYTDDDTDSYSAIFNNSVFDITNADKKRLIQSLKGIQDEDTFSDYMDVTANLKYFAVNSFLVNYDSYTGNLQHNYYVYEKDGILTMLPWDLNLAFAGYQSNDASSAINDPIDTPVSGTTLEQRPMLGQLLNNEEDLKQYHAYLDELVQGYVESGRYEAVIAELKQLISSYVKNDPTALYTYEQYETAVNNLEEFIKLRGESVRGQLDGTIPSTEKGQKADSSQLIDAGDLSITAMGTMGGGQLTEGNIGQSKPDGNAMERPTFNEEDRKQGRPNGRSSMPSQENNSVKTTILLFIGASIVMIVAFIVVKKLPLRKYRS